MIHDVIIRYIEGSLLSSYFLGFGRFDWFFFSVGGDWKIKKEKLDTRKRYSALVKFTKRSSGWYSANGKVRSCANSNYIIGVSLHLSLSLSLKSRNVLPSVRNKERYIYMFKDLYKLFILTYLYNKILLHRLIVCERVEIEIIYIYILIIARIK